MSTVPEQEIAAQLYQTLLRIRRTELRVADIYPSDKIQSPVHLSIGQEGIAAGVCLALDPVDRVYATYRGHGVYIAQGGNLGRMFAELYGKKTGCARGKGGSMHLVAPERGLIGASAIVASTIPVAVGDAMASDYAGRKWVSVSFFGDGALGEGVFFESLNFAALKNLPVLFICENNDLAVHSRVRDRHLKTELYRFGEPLGIQGTRHDGNDVFEVYEVTRQAVREIRAGGAPRLLEFTTCRWMEHVGPGTDHDETYRNQERLAEGLRSDPLVHARQTLEETYGIAESQFDLWEREILAEIEEAVEFAENSSFPEPEELFHGVFKEVRP